MTIDYVRENGTHGTLEVPVSLTKPYNGPQVDRAGRSHVPVALTRSPSTYTAYGPLVYRWTRPGVYSRYN